jgi:hypothetical protein
MVASARLLNHLPATFVILLTHFIVCKGICVYGFTLDSFANIDAFDASLISHALPANQTPHSIIDIASQIIPIGSSLKVFLIFSNQPYLSNNAHHIASQTATIP